MENLQTQEPPSQPSPPPNANFGQPEVQSQSQSLPLAPNFGQQHQHQHAAGLGERYRPPPPPQVYSRGNGIAMGGGSRGGRGGRSGGGGGGGSYNRDRDRSNRGQRYNNYQQHPSQQYQQQSRQGQPELTGFLKSYPTEFPTWDYPLDCPAARNTEIGDKDFLSKLNLGNIFGNCVHDIKPIACTCGRSRAWGCYKCRSFFCTEACSRILTEGQKKSLADVYDSLGMDADSYQERFFGSGAGGRRQQFRVENSDNLGIGNQGQGASNSSNAGHGNLDQQQQQWRNSPSGDDQGHNSSNLPTNLVGGLAGIDLGAGPGRGRGRGRGLGLGSSGGEQAIGLSKPEPPAACLTPTKLELGKEVEAGPSWITDPADLHIVPTQLQSEHTRIEELINSVQNWEKLRVLTVNQPCIAYYRENQGQDQDGGDGGGLYRAVVTQLGPRDSCTIKFIDYGNTVTVPISELKCMPVKLREIPALATQVFSKSICPPNNAAEWSQEAIDYYKNLHLVSGNICKFKPTEDFHGVYFGELRLHGGGDQKGELDVYEEMVKAGFAEWVLDEGDDEDDEEVETSSESEVD